MLGQQKQIICDIRNSRYTIIFYHERLKRHTTYFLQRMEKIKYPYLLQIEYYIWAKVITLIREYICMYYLLLEWLDHAIRNIFLQVIAILKVIEK